MSDEGTSLRKQARQRESAEVAGNAMAKFNGFAMNKRLLDVGGFW